MSSFMRVRSMLVTLVAVYLVVMLIAKAIEQYLSLIIFGIIVITALMVIKRPRL
jgi:hypothetical protein